MSPAGTGGGVSQQPYMQLTQGTANDGYWEGHAYLPRYTRQGRWHLIVRPFDRVDNNREYGTAELDAAGLPNGFDVVSYEDAEAPRIQMVSVFPLEVNVHDADQPVKVRLRASDNLSGIKEPYSGSGIQIGATDPVTHQSSWPNDLQRVSGDNLDGVYEMNVVVRKSSATGLRPINAWVSDAIDNFRSYSSSDVVALGGPPALLVFNVPLPPELLGVNPGDASALVRWSPPADDRGAAVTGYVVAESPGGRELQAKPVTGMVGSRTGRGYLMVAEDGGIFAFGDVPFRGSLGAGPPAVPIVAVTAY